MSADSDGLPSNLAGAQKVVLQTPQTQPSRVRDKLPDFPKGTLIAEASLEGYGIQDLADQMSDILAVAVGESIKFTVRIEFGGETAPDQAKVDQLNALLSDVSQELQLRRGQFS